MRALRLDFHGVTAAVRGDAAALAELARDFAWFRGGAGRADLALELARRRPPKAAPPARLWPRTPRYRVADEGARRTVFYADGARLTWDFAAGRGLAEAAQAWRLRELGYLTLLSRAGESLEERGWRRAHALGFVRGGAAGLVLL